MINLAEAGGRVDARQARQLREAEHAMYTESWAALMPGSEQGAAAAMGKESRF